MTYHQNYYQRNRKKMLADRAQYRKDNPERVLDTKLRGLYGISLDDYNHMLVKQNGVCAICRKAETVIHPASKRVKPLTIDHDHETRKVRGLVCHACNSVLGYVKDSPLVLRSAADYLERYA